MPRGVHTKRAACVNGRCRNWVHVSMFPLCPPCRATLWAGVLGACALGGLLKVLQWI